ncbi:Nuclear hormone receptor family member nhr-12 [Aphelenchoides besseyi]|nr:Nuclear hormone receptor family member nhr-12 [Aphelenchoides besseyi]KAI6207744.1 Nuclear hormone receptor family member nhr-12 [Aphelenchoides besseyi]
MNTEGSEDVPKCLICTDTASGIHFGVMVCRACAAFYRRSTISNRRYVCRFNGNCEIGKDIRCCCRSCRFKKCEALGMKSDAVQRNRDRIGPRKRLNSEQASPSEVEERPSPSSNMHQPSSFNSIDSSTSSTHSGIQHPSDVYRANTNQNSLQIDQDGRSFAQLSSFGGQSAWASPVPPLTLDQFEQTPIGLPYISEMLCGYKKAMALQRTARNLNETTNFNRLFDDNTAPIPGNYCDNIAALHDFVPIVSEMINSSFRPLNSFDTSVKWTLLRQFFCQFIIAYRSYITAQQFPELDDPRFMITFDHFTSINEMDKFFSVSHCKVEPSRMAEIFKPTFTRINAMITNPIRKLKLSETEFVGLLGLLFWNDTLNSLEPNEARMVVETQREIVNELYSVTKLRAGNPLDVSVRFGIICNIVPLASRFASEIGANFSLVNMSNAFSVDENLHELIPHTF